MTRLSRPSGPVSQKPPRIPTMDFGRKRLFSQLSFGPIDTTDFVDIPLRSPSTTPQQTVAQSRTFSWMPGPDAISTRRATGTSQSKLKSALTALKGVAQEQPFLTAGTAIGLPVFAAAVGVGLLSQLGETQRDIAIVVGLAVAVSLMAGGNMLDNCRKGGLRGDEDIELTALLT